MWEWTASWYEKGQVNRVLRGGSWFTYRGSDRCASRAGNVPVSFFSLVGFRLSFPWYISGFWFLSSGFLETDF